ncbi:MAG: hypothetical protein UHM16_07480 [Acutalibacteraceae bacterium]|nr:hypothetical protein [Acutalibacteraceae bacterium]
MSKIKKIASCFIAIVLVLSCSMISVSAASVKWTSRYKTLNSCIAFSQNSPKTQTFTVQGKNNKKLYIQMHVGYDSSLYAAAKRCGYTDKSYYYNTIKDKTRFDITVKDAKGKTVAKYNNVKYGHVTAFKCSKQKYTVTVKSYFSSFNYDDVSHRGASFYAQWSSSYYYK